MKHWIVMFKPETYEVVKDKGVIGVHDMHRRRFQELSPGDKFVAYVSRQMVLDAHGEVMSEPFLDVEPIWGRRQLYPNRARVRFDFTGGAQPGKEALWGLSACSDTEKPMRTSPQNLINCKGGFMEITEADYRWLVEVVEGRWEGWPEP